MSTSTEATEIKKAEKLLRDKLKAEGFKITAGGNYWTNIVSTTDPDAECDVSIDAIYSHWGREAHGIRLRFGTGRRITYKADIAEELNWPKIIAGVKTRAAESSAATKAAQSRATQEEQNKKAQEAEGIPEYLGELNWTSPFRANRQTDGTYNVGINDYFTLEQTKALLAIVELKAPLRST